MASAETKLSPGIFERTGASPPPANAMLAAFPEGIRASLVTYMQRKVLPQGFICQDAGDPIDEIFFPQTGMISCVIPMVGGATIEAGAVGREGAVGAQSGLGHRYSFTRSMVQIAGIFSVLPASRFLQAVSDCPPLRDVISRYIELLWAEAQQCAACNSIHSSSSRLCRWLLQCSDRTGTDQLLLTQEFLAEMLGVRRTTVTLLAQELQDKGFVRYSRGRISIIDRPSLEAFACECYEAMKFETLSHRIGIRL